MTPEHVRAAAIGFALLSVSLIAVGAREWSAGTAEHDQAPRHRSGWRGNVLLFIVSLILLAGICVFADFAGWSRDRALWIGLGGFLGVMTIVRPWWFWDNYRARWLRNVIGDGPTMALYMALAGMMVWVGLYTDWTFGRR